MIGAEQFNYDRLQSALQSAGIDVGASELHGIVCGAICNQIKSGLEHDLRELIVNGEVGGPDAMTPLEEPIRSLYQSATTMLHQSDAEFGLLLPDDELSIADRTEALASWCRGFMFGLLHNDAFAIEQLPGDAGEIARDFLAFADAESGNEPSEDDERALVEIEEYIRVGVQLIFEELYAEHPDGRPAGGVH